MRTVVKTPSGRTAAASPARQPAAQTGTGLTAPSSPLWIALHLPALSLESWAATRGPGQADQPLALLHDQQIVHADALALARGVRPGMTRATALALAPDLLLAAADAQRDAQALRAVVHVALAFSPAVAWATPAGLRAQGAYRDAQPQASPALVGVRLEVQASLRYFGGLAKLLHRLRAALAPLGHRVQIASAPTALGAALLASGCGGWGARGNGNAGDVGDVGVLCASTDSAASAVSADPVDLGNAGNAGNAGDVGNAGVLRASTDLANLASGPPITGPNTGPEPGRWPALQTLLDAVPLTALSAGRDHGPALHGMGLHTLADLRGLPRAGLARRFGPALLDEIDRARGHVPEAHVWLTLPPRFASRIELLCRADTSAQVLAGAQLLLARLLAWADASRARVAGFSLLMHHEPRRRRDAGMPTHSTLDIALAEPMADAKHLHSLLAEHLGRLPLAAPALELSLHCAHLVAGTAPSGELFASRSSEREGLSRLVERLQARLGAAQVQSLAPVADHRPECGTRWQPADPARLGAAAAAPAGVHAATPAATSATKSATKLATTPAATPAATPSATSTGDSPAESPVRRRGRPPMA